MIFKKKAEKNSKNVELEERATWGSVLGSENVNIINICLCYATIVGPLVGLVFSVL